MGLRSSNHSPADFRIAYLELLSRRRQPSKPVAEPKMRMPRPVARTDGDATREFTAFAAPLIGLPVSHVWRGHGSALFLEFGQLRPSNLIRRDGSSGNPRGEMSLMIEWSWRIEGRRSILCGSWSDEQKWPRTFGLMRGATMTNAALFGRLPEIELSLSNGIHLMSFMTAEGSPEWALIDRRGDKSHSLSVRRGTLRHETSEKEAD